MARDKYSKCRRKDKFREINEKPMDMKDIKRNYHKDNQDF